MKSQVTALLGAVFVVLGVGESALAQSSQVMRATVLQTVDLSIADQTQVVVLSNEVRREDIGYFVKEGECSIVEVVGSQAMVMGEELVLTYYGSGMFFFKRAWKSRDGYKYDLSIHCGGRTGELDSETKARLNSVLGEFIRIW